MKNSLIHGKNSILHLFLFYFVSACICIGLTENQGWAQSNSGPGLQNSGNFDKFDDYDNIQEKTVYRCIEQNGNWMTVAENIRGTIPLIKWESNFFGSQWTPDTRCRAVSNRFEIFKTKDLLHFISTGRLNNYPIICVSGEYGDCLPNGLLLTLQPDENANYVLQNLFDLSTSITRRTTKHVIDLEYILEEKKTLEPQKTNVEVYETEQEIIETLNPIKTP